MRVVFLFSEYVLHNHIIEEFHAQRPNDELLIVKVPLRIKSKGRVDSAKRIFPRLSRRFLVAKLAEYCGLLVLTYCPKLFSAGAVFRRLRRIASRIGAHYLESSNISSPETLAQIEAFQPDLIFTMMHQIVGRKLIAIPKHGVVNIHPGLLPDFRGIQPYFWELSEGAKFGGCSIHFIQDETIDTGDVLAQARFPLADIGSVQLNYYLTARAAAILLPNIAQGIESGAVTAVPQVPGSGRYYQWPDSSAYDRLWRSGRTLFWPRDFYHILSGRYDSFEPEEKGSGVFHGN